MADKQIEITEYPIRLGQFLKRAAVSSDGLEAKILITAGQVLVNGTVETRRGRQLAYGDIVTIHGRDYICG